MTQLDIMPKEKSMADKVIELGIDIVEFKKDLFALNDKMIGKCTVTLDFSRKNLEKNVYPDLQRMKRKYGFNVPVGICGVDMPKLDKLLDNALFEKRLREKRKI